MAWDGWVPFVNGRMLEYEGIARLWTPGVDQNLATSSGAPARVLTWLRGEVCESMRYVGYHRGRSAIRLEFVGVESGRTYGVGIASFDKVARELVRGEIPARRWLLAKQGANYVLRPVVE